MNSDRWQQISRLYQAALAREGDDRAAFLAEACRGDEPLRREVESLLAQPASAQAFLHAPALAHAAQMVSDVGASALVGRLLGAYQVQARLGAGGMGEVYRARDTKLGRDVAIKVLPRAFISDPERLARFEREARMLAALNHPNIGAIYGLEDADGMRALVLELVEGETLADCIARGALSMKDTLAIARQIADALDAAHDKGVVHRDLKPSNVALTREGTVKVLDFGLAKANATDSTTGGSQAPTMTIGATREGVVLGTAAYMSPEQARGHAVDKRTDIWAFGCVLYEMLTGHVAFPGKTIPDTLASVLEREPGWAALPAATPLNIRRLLRRCLEKDAKRRLRDIGDAGIEIEDALSGSVSETEAPVRELHSRKYVIGSGIVAVVAVIAAFVLGRTARSGLPADAAPTFTRVVRVTSGPKQERGPAISPDGKWIAYLSDAGGSTDVWVKFLAGGEPANLTASSGLEVTSGTGISGLEISPDGTRIAVIARPRGNTAPPTSVWEIPAPLAGVPRKLIEGGAGVHWSTDGRQIAFIRAGGLAGDALFVADADGTNQNEIVKAHDGMHVHWPTWSPDGSIYFTRTFDTTVANQESADIYRIPSRGGSMEPVVSTSRRAMFPVPMPEGGGLIYSANPTAAELSLWWRPANGEARRLTTGVGEYAEPRISADGKTLICTLYEFRQSLVRIDVASAQMTAITDGYSGDLDPTLARYDERVVFSSSRDGNRHLWTARLDGRDARPLTSGVSLDAWPSFSPDGQRIAFVSDRGGQRAIWLINPEGGAPRKLADVAPLGRLSWSSDSRQIVYSAGAGDWPGLWRVSVADGRISRIPTAGAASEPAASTTRDLIAYLSPSTSGPSTVSVAFVNASGQPVPLRMPQAPPAGFASGLLAWSPDGRRLAVVRQPTNTEASVWIVEPDTSNPYRKVIEFPPGPRIRGLSWTQDGSALIIGKHESTSDIVLLTQTP